MHSGQFDGQCWWTIWEQFGVHCQWKNLVDNFEENFGDDLVETLWTILESCLWTIWWAFFRGIKVQSGEIAMHCGQL